MSGTGPRIQRKASGVSFPEDPDERQADELAERVVGMGEPARVSLPQGAIQRKCADCEDEEKKEPRALRMASSGGGPALDTGVALRVAGNGGTPLPTGVRSYFEARFGHDFGRVRVHADDDAASGARAISAKAYTVGRDIVFGPGQYAPETGDGKRLLAHELAHVVQQGASAAVSSTPSHGKIQRFTEPGHKMIGDEAYGKEALTLAPGLVMTFGDAVAMGDYFGSFKEMQDLAKTPGIDIGQRGEVSYVLWVKIRQKPYKEKLDKWYTKRAAFRADQRANYLTATNISHFPNPLSGDTSLTPLEKATRKDKDGPVGAAASYREGHWYALKLAYDDGKRSVNDPTAGRDHSAMEDALLADAFACHYLTDAFSASHAKTPRQSIKEYWDKLVPGFHEKLINYLTDQIVSQHWGVKREGAYLAGGSVRTLTHEKLTVALGPPGYLSFGNVVSLIIHDVQGAQGVEASIEGDKITLVGDQDLVTDDVDPVTGDHTHEGKGDRARGTLNAAARAVKASVDDLYEAFEAGYRGQDISAALRKTIGAYSLFKAERLIPQPIDDSQLPAASQSLPWRQKDADAFLSDPRIKEGLKRWGPLMAQTLLDTLDQIQERGGLEAEARKGIEKALLTPLKSGNPDEIRKIILAMIGGHPVGHAAAQSAASAGSVTSASAAAR